ncbi:hypothetical protein D1164_02930 [Mariniphaga sediminis]|uniref:Uncharacterized protein n=1 Tax=Mariniphaga sediminis TaxID=1628158 RepID=A0A399D3R3_9BACT|nr:hypothetical protein D1164_15885 [Mariniphaga sediminis]RIH66575.1 hypothetical protein D1164_02930 [Mariniphaga sediminis]
MSFFYLKKTSRKFPGGIPGLTNPALRRTAFCNRFDKLYAQRKKQDYIKCDFFKKNIQKDQIYLKSSFFCPYNRRF